MDCLHNLPRHRFQSTFRLQSEPCTVSLYSLHQWHTYCVAVSFFTGVQTLLVSSILLLICEVTSMKQHAIQRQWSLLEPNQLYSRFNKSCLASIPAVVTAAESVRGS